jgi:hypothetical protein
MRLSSDVNPDLTLVKYMPVQPARGRGSLCTMPGRRAGRTVVRWSTVNSNAIDMEHDIVDLAGTRRECI